MADCSQCGTSNQPDADFCTQCGARLPAAAQQPAPPMWQPPPPPAGQAPAYGTPQPPPPYGPPGGLVRQPPSEGMAVASLVLGIASYPFICAFGGGLIFAVLGVVFGYLARNKIDESNGALGGRQMAVAGIVLGWISIALHLIVAIVVIVLVITGVWWSSHSNAAVLAPLLAML